jgi:hypothetical protein
MANQRATALFSLPDWHSMSDGMQAVPLINERPQRDPIMSKKRTLAFILFFLFAFASVQRAQTLQNLVHQPQNGAGIGFLLTDGTVMFQGDNVATWWKLAPDGFGSYLNGTWAQLASLPSGYSPLYFASAVLADGRLLVMGGEYNFGIFALTNLGAIYDPLTNTWTSVPAPLG